MVRLEIQFADGTSETETVEAPRGSEQKFASEADVVDKFRKLARAVFADAEIDRIAEMVLGCDKLADIGVLVAALAPGRDEDFRIII